MLHCLRVLVNPPGRVARGVQLDMSAVTEAAAANPTVRKLLDMFGEGGGSFGGRKSVGRCTCRSGREGRGLNRLWAWARTSQAGVQGIMLRTLHQAARMFHPRKQPARHSEQRVSCFPVLLQG